MSRPASEALRIHAFVDGELGVTEQLAMEALIGQDSALCAEVEALRRLRENVQAGATAHVAPPGLALRLQLDPAEPFASTAPPAPGRRPFRAPAWRAFAGGAMLAAALSTFVVLLRPPPSPDDRLADEVVASHVRATLGERLVDVASSDRHTVKPWLSSKLDFSPPVVPLQPGGAVLAGGRVDYLGGHPVATLVYRRRAHVVDAFVWPTSAPDGAHRALAQRGFNIQHWSRGGMAYWLVSDLNREELAALATELDDAIVSASH